MTEQQRIKESEETKKTIEMLEALKRLRELTVKEGQENA